jgi:hypothetical protein
MKDISWSELACDLVTTPVGERLDAISDIGREVGSVVRGAIAEALGGQPVERSDGPDTDGPFVGYEE